MLEIATIVLPVFLVVLVGYLASRAGLMSDDQIDALMRFTVFIAAPAFLFFAVATLDFAAALDPVILGVYYVPVIAMLVFGAFAGRRFFGQRPGEAVASGFTATFANSLFLGLPIVERAYGGESMQPALAVVSIHAAVCYLAGGILMESARQDGTGAFAAFTNGVKTLSRNPLVIGVALGALWNLLLPPLPLVIGDATQLLASAALPVGMFSVGAALTRYSLVGDLKVTAFYVGLTLIVRPALVLLLALAFGLSEPALKAVVLLAAMPGGMNIYIFASMYKRSEALAANALLLGTALGIISVSLWLAALG